MQAREGRRERRAQNWTRDDWRAAEHGRYQGDRSYGEDWSITRGQVYEGDGEERGHDLGGSGILATRPGASHPE